MMRAVSPPNVNHEPLASDNSVRELALSIDNSPDVPNRRGASELRTIAGQFCNSDLIPILTPWPFDVGNLSHLIVVIEYDALQTI